MKYAALMIGIAYDLFNMLNFALLREGIVSDYALTISDGIRVLTRKNFHLIVIDTESIKKENRVSLLYSLRQTKFAPIFVLNGSDEVEETIEILEVGIDMCLPANMPESIIEGHAVSLVRRYTTYNHYEQSGAPDVAPFAVGNIYIDPLRHYVLVAGKPVALRPREFALLLYFMRNPQIVLSADQICESAWGIEGSYGHGVGQPIGELRKQIEPDPKHPIYIETVYGVGYRFMESR